MRSCEWIETTCNQSAARRTLLKGWMWPSWDVTTSMRDHVHPVQNWLAKLWETIASSCGYDQCTPKVKMKRFICSRGSNLLDSEAEPRQLESKATRWLFEGRAIERQPESALGDTLIRNPLQSWANCTLVCTISMLVIYEYVAFVMGS